MVDTVPSRVLYIDLTHKRFWVEDRRELFEKYLGGAGVAIKLLEEEVPKNADPLGPENAIIFAVGPFTALYPTASKTVAMFKSPHTGNLGESHAGGRSAIAIRLAGYGAIVIRGTSEMPVWVAVHGQRVYFRDARALWGMSSSHTVGRIIRENEPGRGFRTIMRIGRAGEKMVTYASVITETYRHFGRLGLGAVFGSKKLKALVVSGRSSIKIPDKRSYREVYNKIYDLIVNSTLMKKYHDLGTPMNVLPLNKMGALPTRNLQSTRLETADKISGEYLAENYLGRRLAMLGATEPEGMLKLMDKVDALGLDAMSTGVALAWATEAYKRGLITEQDLAGLKLEWGDYETYLQAVEYIVEQPTDFYKALARGAAYASKVYGGEEFALVFGGNEMPGYHTGPAAPFSFAVGSRHSHLDMGGYSLDEKTIGKQLAPEEIVDKLLAEERWRQILSSLVICFFARGVYKPELVVEAFKPLGYEFTVEDLQRLGKEIHLNKYRFKMREGFSLEKIKLPKRIFETPTPHGKLSEEFMQKLLDLFRQKIMEDLKSC